MQIKLKTETCNRGRPSKRKSEETTQTRVGEKPSVPLPNNDGRCDMRHWSAPVIEKKKMPIMSEIQLDDLQEV